MRPALVFGETGEEAAGGDGAGVAAADVVDVGEGGVELALVFVPQRQAPCTVEHVLAGLQQFIGEVVVLAHQAGGVFAQRDDAGPGERGHIQQRLRLEALRVGQGIAENQPAFGVGVADFDGLAGHAGQHIGRAIAQAVGHVFDRRHNHYQIDRQLHAHRSNESAHDRGGAAHVVFHFLDAAGGFQIDAAGVEGDAFADEDVRFCVAAAAVIGRAAPLQHNEFRRIGRAQRYRQQRAHAQRLHLIAIQHFAAGFVELAGEDLRLFGEVGRIADVGRQVAQFSGEGDAGGDGFALAQRCAIGAADGDRGEFALAFGFVFLAERGVVAVGGVAEGDHGLADGPGGVAAQDGGFADGEGDAGCGAVFQRAGGVAGGFDVLRHAEFGDVAQADYQHPWCGHAGQVVEQGGLAGFAGHVAAFDQRRNAAAAGGVEDLAGGGQGLVRVDTDDDAVAGEGGGVGGGAGVERECKGHQWDSVEAVGERLGEESCAAEIQRLNRHGRRRSARAPF